MGGKELFYSSKQDITSTSGVQWPNSRSGSAKKQLSLLSSTDSIFLFIFVLMLKILAAIATLFLFFYFSVYFFLRMPGLLLYDHDSTPISASWRRVSSNQSSRVQAACFEPTTHSQPH